MGHCFDNSISFIRLLLNRSRTVATFLRIAAAVFIVPATCMPFMAHSTPSQLYEKWKQDAEALGATIRNGPILYDADADRLTVPDLEISYSSLYDISETVSRFGLYSVGLSGVLEEEIIIELKIAAGSTVMSGIMETGEYAGIDKVEFPDDLHLDLVIHFGVTQLSMSAQFIGLMLENAVHSNPSTDPSTGIDSEVRWVQVFNHFGFDQAGSGKADSLEYTFRFNLNDHKLFEYALEEANIEFREYRNSVLGTYKSEDQKTKVDYFFDMDEELDSEITTVEEIYLTSLNLNSYIELLDIPKNRGSGNSSFFEKYSAENIASNSGGAISTIESIEVQNYSVSLQNLDVLGIIALLTTDVPLESIHFYTDMIRSWLSIDIGELTVKGIESIGPINADGNPLKLLEELKSFYRFSIDEISWGKGQNSNREEFSITGFNIGSLTEGANLNIGGFRLSNITTAGSEEIEKFLNEIEANETFPDDPITFAKHLLPRSLSLEISDLELSSSGSNSKETILRIGRINNSFSSDVPPVPTELILEGNNIEIPMDDMDIPSNLDFLEDLKTGILNLSFSAKLQWKEETEELLLEYLKIDMADLGVLEANLRFSGIEKKMLENPLGIASQLDSVIFESADFAYTDKGAFRGYVETAAKDLNQSGSEAGTLAKILILQLAGFLTAEFALQIEPELEKFLSSPENFTLSAAPKAPMSILNFMGLAAVPSALPHVLDIEVKANQ